MKLGQWTERKTATGNIALIALGSAISAILSLIVSFVPFSAFILVLVLPSVSSLTARLIENKYVPLFFLSSAALILLLTPHDLLGALLYAIPSALNGAVYGYLSKKRMPLGASVMLSSLLTLALTCLSFPLLDSLLGIDVIASTLGLLQLGNNEKAHDLVPLFIYAYAMAASAISSLIIEITTAKIALNDRKAEYSPFISLPIPVLSIAYMLLFETAAAWAYLLLGFAFSLLVFSIPFYLNGRRWWDYLILAIAIVIGLALYPALAPFIETGAQGALLGFVPMFFSLSIGLSGLLENTVFAKGDKKS